MKRLALYLGIVATLAASCTVQEMELKTFEPKDGMFYATFEQPGDAGTRVYANEDLLLRWTADDRVSIFNKITCNQEYKFLGETGDNGGGFNRVDHAEFVTGNTIPNIVSVYPYRESTRISEEEVLTLTLPAEQKYAENTFGLGANTMVSVSSDNVLMYKNVGGYLKFRFYGNTALVTSVTLKGNNGERLAGKAFVTMPLDGVPSVTLDESATKEIQCCNEKIEALTGHTPTLFRPPYGDYNNDLVKTVKSLGMYCIQWDVDSLDWKDPTPEQMCKTVLDKVTDGSIVLMHNGAKNTPAALPSIIEGIQDKGYEIVLIKDLIPEGEYYTDVQGEMHLSN